MTIDILKILNPFIPNLATRLENRNYHVWPLGANPHKNLASKLQSQVETPQPSALSSQICESRFAQHGTMGCPILLESSS